MKKTKDGYLLTEDEIIAMKDFIDSSLDYQWDKHTDVYICSDSNEDGKKRMNPGMYEMRDQINMLLYESTEDHSDKRLYVDW